MMTLSKMLFYLLFIMLAPTLWNYLPADVVKCPSGPAFKTAVCHHHARFPKFHLFGLPLFFAFVLFLLPVCFVLFFVVLVFFLFVFVLSYFVLFLVFVVFVCLFVYLFFVFVFIIFWSVHIF